jgi:polygalacturonase
MRPSSGCCGCRSLSSDLSGCNGVKLENKAMLSWLIALGGLSFVSCSLVAQDTRTVTEPAIPAACTTLSAQLSAGKNGLAAGDETKLDTGRIQNAIDNCSHGHAVVLRRAGANNSFLSGPLQLRTGVTLVVEKGVTLFGSRDAAQYETSPGSCGIVDEKVPGPGCKPLISVIGASEAGIMGDGTIDGRGGSKLLGKEVSWWDLADQARPGEGQKVSHLVVAEHSNNFTLYRITLKNSPNYHVGFRNGDGFTVWGVKIDTPGKGARNTDGIQPQENSRNITITHTYINAGDDDIAVKAGAAGGVTNFTVSHSHFYAGHGMAIGSDTKGGVSKVRVFDLSLDSPDNGIRVKSNAARGGLVHDVVYDDVCVRNSPNPILFDTAYSANGSMEGTSYPTFVDITLRNVRVSGGGKISLNGFSQEHRLGLNLDDVLLTDAGSARYTYSVRHADFRVGPGPVNVNLQGEDSKVTGSVLARTGEVAESCADKFVQFPR